MKYLRLYENFKRDKFYIKEKNGKKFITGRFTPGKGNVPSWTDNEDLMYTYDTEDDAEDAAQALINDGFMSTNEYVVVPVPIRK